MLRIHERVLHEVSKKAKQHIDDESERFFYDDKKENNDNFNESNRLEKFIQNRHLLLHCHCQPKQSQANRRPS